MSKSKVVKLRSVCESDLSMILTWRNAENVRNNMYTNHMITAEEHLKWFKKIVKDESYKLLILEIDSEPKGVVNFSKIDKHNNHAYWGFYSGVTEERGIGSKMEVIALMYAFEVLGLNKLNCEVLSFNERVISFHKKFNFHEEGKLKEHYCRNGVYYDIHQLAFFCSDWTERGKQLKDKYLKNCEVSILC